MRLSFVLSKSQHIIIGIGDGEFGCAIEGLLQVMDEIDFVPDAVEEGPDLLDFDIEDQRAAILAADLGKGIAEALKGLEHEADVAAGHHGPDELSAFAFAWYGHDQVEAEQLVEFDGRANIFYKEIGGKRVHFISFLVGERFE